MAKRFFIGSSLFLLTMLLLWGVYSIFFSVSKKAASESDTDTPVATVPVEQEVSPQESSGAIQSVNATPVLSPSVSSEEGGTLLYINKNTGTFEKLRIEDGTVTALSNSAISSPVVAIWARDGSRAIVKETMAGAPAFQLFSLKTSASPTSLKSGIRFVTWDSLENGIVYLFQDGSGNTSLNRALPDGSQWKRITTLPSSSYSFTPVPKSTLVAFWKKPLNTRMGELQTVNLTNDEVKTVFAGKYGADYLFSPDGERILMSWAPEKNGQKMSLALINKNGGEYTDLNFPTLAQKCVWASDSVTAYCALPGSIPQNASMPDAWLDRSFQSADTFWKVDTKTGKSTRVVALENMRESYDATELLLAPDESRLFFVNRRDAKLYSIEL